MHPALRTPLIECFLRGNVSRDLRLVAAQGLLAPRAHDQLTLLVMLAGDPDPNIAATADTTTASLPVAPLAAFLARADVPHDLRAAFVARTGALTGVSPAPTDEALDVGRPDPHDVNPEVISVDDAEVLDVGPGRRPLSSLTVIERMKLAARGTREQRAVLVRDPNKFVAAAVLGSPTLTDAEIDAFARMGNVSEDVLRVIGSNRRWMKSYSVAASLARNPRTPAVVSVPLVSRLTERDLKGLASDRNVPEGVRLAARKLMMANESRRR